MAFPSIHSDNILSIVNDLREDGGSAYFCLDTREHLLSGKQCLIYTVQLPDGITWAVPIPVHTSNLAPEDITGYLEIEVSILKLLEIKGFA